MLGSKFGAPERLKYNQLGAVERSFEALSIRGDFVDFLSGMAQLAFDNGLEGDVGAFLLHRHFEAGLDEILLEQPTVLPDGRPALVTQAIEFQDSASAPQAVRWSLGEKGSFIALEFSSDPGAMAASRHLSEQLVFLSEYAELLRSFNLQDLIGLCVADRHYLIPTDEMWLIETTDKMSSVVTLEPGGNGPDEDFIPTCWVPTIEMYCSVLRRCDPLMSCRRRCSRDGDGGHGYAGHDQINVSHNSITVGHDDR